MNHSATIRDVYLTGMMGRKFGKHHRLSVASPAEAVRALCATMKGFRQYLMESGDKGIKFNVWIGDDNITEDQLKNPAGKDTITFAPALKGKKSGTLAAIAGVILIVVGVFLMFTPFAAAAPWVIGAGIGLLAIGVAGMLAPQSGATKDKEKPDSRVGAAFNGPLNTQAQGGPVPYFAGGPAFIGSAVISASISTVDGLYVPSPSTLGVGGGSAAWAQAFREATVPAP